MDKLSEKTLDALGSVLTDIINETENTYLTTADRKIHIDCEYNNMWIAMSIAISTEVIHYKEDEVE